MSQRGYGASCAALLLLNALAGCTSAAAAPELLDAGELDAGPTDPLAAERALFAARLDPHSLDLAITQLDALSSPDAQELECDALLFRAAWARARHFTRERAAMRSDSGRARVLALQLWEAEQPGASSRLEPGLLRSTLPNASPRSAGALTRLAEADWSLAAEVDPPEGAHLRRESLAVAGRAVELASSALAPRAQRLWATALAVLPRPAGGDFARARFELEDAIAAEPDDIAGRVEEAARVAVKARDRALFRALLMSALRADPEPPGAEAPERELARVRALWLAHHERALLGR